MNRVNVRTTSDVFIIFQWSLFPVQDLNCFEAMTGRLYKHRCQRVVNDYEALRMALNSEMARRIEEKKMKAAHMQHKSRPSFKLIPSSTNVETMV